MLIQTKSNENFATNDNVHNAVEEMPKAEWKDNSERKAQQWLLVGTLQLTQRDKHRLESNEWLTDRHMDAAQHIVCMHTQQSMQSVLLAQSNYSEVPETDLYVQIHFEANHWTVSALVRGQIWYADSFRSRPGASIVQQMKKLYAKRVNSDYTLDIVVLPVQRQQNGNDCGLFAVANAFAIASDINPSNLAYNVDEMRDHFKLCLETVALIQFPHGKTKRGRPRSSVLLKV